MDSIARTIVISFDGDEIGKRIGIARLSNDIAEVRRVNQSIDAGNRVFEAFIDSTLGAEKIEIAGDEGSFIIPADKLSELPSLCQKYQDLTGASVTVGVGRNLEQSSKALLIGKLHGKAQIVIYDPEMEEEIKTVMEHPQSEVDKQKDAFRGSEDTDFLTKSADPAEIQKRLQPWVPKSIPESTLPPVQVPTQEAAPQEAPLDENEFHNIAQQQGAKDLQNKEHSKETLAQIKESVTQTLQSVRVQLPALAQLQQTAPEAYQSIIALVQSVCELGKETMQFPDMAKSEDLMKALSQIEPGIRTESKLEPHRSAPGVKIFSRTFDYSHLLPSDAKNSGFKLQVHHKNTMLPKGVKSIPTSSVQPHLMPIRPTEYIHSSLQDPTGKEIGTVMGHVSKKGTGKAIMPHSDLDAPYKGKGFGTAMYEAVYAHAKQAGVNRVEGGVHSPDAHALHTRLSAKHGFHYKAEKEKVPDKYFPYKAYSYALKSEMDGHINEDGFIGEGHGPIFYRDDEIQKDEENPSGGQDANEGKKRVTGANSGGAQAGRAHMNLPVGTLLNGKTKIINGSTGLANWRSVKGGAIASQQHNPPILGANSSATSANNPDR